MNWVRKVIPAKSTDQDSTLMGLAIDTSFVRAVQGPAQIEPKALTLNGKNEDLPMILSLEARHPRVGQPGADVRRRSPHLTCDDFLVHLGERREWSAGRHRLNAAQALTFVFHHLRASCGSGCVVLSLPGYLTRAQVALIPPLAGKEGIKVIGSVAAPLAFAQAAFATQPWMGTALVVDVDDHALSASTLTTDGHQIWLHATHSWPQLSLRAWKGRLLDCVADRCVRQSRRDPRESAAAEQSLYDQLDNAFDRCTQSKSVELLIQTVSWYQSLIIQSEEFTGFCDRFVGQSVECVRAHLAAGLPGGGLRRLFLTYAAARLPGLAGSLGKLVQEQPLERAENSSVDFGEDLLECASGAAVQAVLATDAAARAAHDLAGRIARGELSRSHFDMVLPVSKSIMPSDSNPARTNLRILSPDP